MQYFAVEVDGTGVCLHGGTNIRQRDKTAKKLQMNVFKSRNFKYAYGYLAF